MALLATFFAIGIATAPPVDMNQFPTDLTPQEFTQQESVTGNRYEDFNGTTVNPFL